MLQQTRVDVFAILQSVFRLVSTTGSLAQALRKTLKLGVITHVPQYRTADDGKSRRVLLLLWGNLNEGIGRYSRETLVLPLDTDGRWQMSACFSLPFWGGLRYRVPNSIVIFAYDGNLDRSLPVRRFNQAFDGFDPYWVPSQSTAGRETVALSAAYQHGTMIVIH